MAEKAKLMQGNEACTMAAIAAGARVLRGLSDYTIHRNRRNVRGRITQGWWQIYPDGR
jgi:hypothetical protein